MRTSYLHKLVSVVDHNRGEGVTGKGKHYYVNIESVISTAFIKLLKYFENHKTYQTNCNYLSLLHTIYNCNKFPLESIMIYILHKYSIYLQHSGEILL